MSRFDSHVLREPRWMAAVIVGVLLAAAFTWLGLWQLSRLDERRASNAVIEDRLAEPARPIEGLVGQYGMDPDLLAYRRAVVSGVYREDLEFFSIGRTYGDRSGTLVATPLELADGSLLVVVRGLVPVGTSGPPAAGYLPPAGSVELVGRLDDGEEPLGFGEADPEGGVLTSLSRLDLAYIDEWIEGDVLPISLLLEEQRPPSDPSPVPIPPDELTEGRHFGYATQWFGFAVITIIGVAYLVWRAGSSASRAEGAGDPAV